MNIKQKAMEARAWIKENRTKVIVGVASVAGAMGAVVVGLKIISKAESRDEVSEAADEYMEDLLADEQPEYDPQEYNRGFMDASYGFGMHPEGNEDSDTYKEYVKGYEAGYADGAREL